MKRHRLASRIAGLAFAVAATYASAGDARIPIAGGGSLILPIPEGWRDSRHPGPVATLSISPANGEAFQVLVSTLVSADGRMASASRESLRRLVESEASSARAQSVEKSLPIQELGPGEVQGSYFSATDRAPKAGEFKNMTQGAMSVGGLPVTFTILSNGDPKVAVEPALRMLRAAHRE